MKKLLLSLVVFLVALTIGCQETSITNPPVPDATQLQGNVKNLAKDEIGVAHNIIGLKYPLADPVRQVPCELTGQVEYNTKILSSVDDIRYFRVKVSLKMFSQLCPLFDKEHPLWVIQGKSEDILLFDKISFTTPTKSLIKVYKVRNRSDIVLCVTYEVGQKVVKVKDIKLNAAKNQIFDVL